MAASSHKRVYLALAMEGRKQREIKESEKAFRQLLGVLPVEVSSTFHENHVRPGPGKDKQERAKRIVNKDLELLSKADIVLVDYSIQGHNYVGCTCEIVYAHGLKKPIIVYTGDTGNEDRTWLVYHATHICTTKQDVVDAMRKVLAVTDPTR